MSDVSTENYDPMNDFYVGNSYESDEMLDEETPEYEEFSECEVYLEGDQELSRAAKRMGKTLQGKNSPSSLS